MAFAPRNYDKPAERCRQLAERVGWSTDILDQWGTPVAFDYWRRREELRTGQVLAAMIQLKARAEVLLKLVVSVAGRDSRDLIRDVLGQEQPPPISAQPRNDRIRDPARIPLHATE